MKEIEHKETPEVSGGQVDAYGDPLPIGYPIYQLPPEQPVNPMIVRDTPLP